MPSQTASMDSDDESDSPWIGPVPDISERVHMTPADSDLSDMQADDDSDDEPWIGPIPEYVAPYRLCKVITDNNTF